MQSKISFFLTKSEEWFCRRTRLDTIVQCGNKSPAASGFSFLILATGLWVVIKISHSTFNLDPGSWISLLNPIAGWGRPCWKPWRSWVVTARPSPCPNTSLLFLMMMMMMMIFTAVQCAQSLICILCRGGSSLQKPNSGKTTLQFWSQVSSQKTLGGIVTMIIQS